MSTVETKATLETENARLQARVDELEAELHESRKTKRSHKSESEKLRDDTLDGVADEANRLFRAMAHALGEELRAAGDVVKSVADEAAKRSDAHSMETDRSLYTRLTDLTDDLSAVVNRGIKKSLATPQHVIDKFHEVYHERSNN